MVSTKTSIHTIKDEMKWMRKVSRGPMIHMKFGEIAHNWSVWNSLLTMTKWTTMSYEESDVGIVEGVSH